MYGGPTTQATPALAARSARPYKLVYSLAASSSVGLAGAASWLNRVTDLVTKTTNKELCDVTAQIGLDARYSLDVNRQETTGTWQQRQGAAVH